MRCRFRVRSLINANCFSSSHIQRDLDDILFENRSANHESGEDAKRTIQRRVSEFGEDKREGDKKISERESLGKRFGASPAYCTEPRDECIVINDIIVITKWGVVWGPTGRYR